MKSLWVLFLILLTHSSKAQQIPDSVTHSAEALAGYLKNSYVDPALQVKNLYTWISRTIKYDTDSAMYFNWTANHSTKIAATLRRRKAVCENYASLMVDIATRLQIPAYVVHGYPLYSNNNKDNCHSWVAIQQQGDWFLCDPTWDAQYGTEKYYMVSPAEFITTHIPFDPLWQLLEKPEGYNATAGRFMYKDSVKAFLVLDSLQQYLAMERRMKNARNQNAMNRTWQSFNKMNIAVIAGEKDEEWYNAAVAALNKANHHFNNFVQYRNNRFIPIITDTAIKQLLQPIPALLKECEAALGNMGKLSENFQYDPGPIRSRVLSLEKRVAEQQSFLLQYLAAAPAERIKML